MPKRTTSIGKLLRKIAQAGYRLREWFLVRTSPAANYRIDMSHLPEVSLTAVETDGQKDALIELFERNPSPFLAAPDTREALEKRIEKGIEYYLVHNSEGELVGARAFRVADNFMLHAVTDYQHRRKGYRLAASNALMDLLRQRGIRHLHANAIKANTRMLRGAESAGWKIKPHPDDPNLVKLTRTLDPP